MGGGIYSITDETRYEQLISGLLENQFGYADDFLDEQTVQGLREKLFRYLDAGMMQPAGVGRKFDYIKNTEVRGDVIKWIDHDTADPFEIRFLNRVKDFVRYLNESCFTGINDFEFHYAYYEKNSFYKRHLDQFRADKGRKFSLVTYLNDQWKNDDGGRLSLYLEDKVFDLYPLGGRAVFFRSDRTEHEVHPAPYRPRLSIAGWLKRI